MSLAGDALTTSFGRVFAQRAGAAVLLWVLVGIIDQGESRAMWAVPVLGIALALVDSEASHAVGTHPAWLSIGLNAMHIVAMSVWIGGLIAFLVIVRQPEISGMRTAVFRRFGRLAGGSFLLLVLTGVAMAVQHLAAPADLVTTTYGRVLGVKLAVVLDVGLVALGGAIVNRVAEKKRQQGDYARRWWGVELLLLVCVLALAGLLSSLVPPI